MTTDRELLELAAKAAGYAIHDFYLESDVWAYQQGSELNHDGELPIFMWRPLTDDGDAFRLMVHLNLLLKECCNSEECYPQGYGHKKVIEFFVAQDGNASQLAAARRAIVRAAAAIGAKS